MMGTSKGEKVRRVNLSMVGISKGVSGRRVNLRIVEL